LRILSSILLTVAVLGVPSVVLAWGRSTSAFTVERVVLSGTHAVPKKQARDSLEKAFVGDNLFTVGHDDVRRVLARQCYVADVELDRDFPDTLRVRVIEHSPALALLAEGRWFVVSDQAHVVCEAPAKSGGDSAASGSNAASSEEGAAKPSAEEATAVSSSGAEDSPPAADEGEDPSGRDETAGGDKPSRGALLAAGPAGREVAELPRLAGESRPKVGARADDAKVEAALAALAGLPKGLRRQVVLVEVSEALRVTVTMGDLVVRLGDAARLGDKVLALRAVAAAYRAQGLRPSHIDVSVPERPLGRPLLEG
jgi:cell division septal protein FtsQ